MAKTYGPLLQEVWRTALILPGYDDLLRSLASEVGGFLGLDESAAVDAMESAWANRANDALRRFPKHVTEESLAEFYSDSQQGMLVSAYWHSLIPDRYALHGVAALHVAQTYASGTRLLEVGHGIGSTSVLLARHGLDVSMGDVSDVYIEFARSRFASRDLKVQSLDLRDGYPPPGSQDVVVCLDVLEHVLDPVGLVQSMVRTLSDDGLLILNVAYGLDPNTPEHLMRRRLGFLDRLRSFDIEPLPHPTLDVFWKRRQASWERPIRRAEDLLVVASRDVAARAPRLARLVRRASSPPMG